MKSTILSCVMLMFLLGARPAFSQKKFRNNKLKCWPNMAPQSGQCVYTSEFADWKRCGVNEYASGSLKTCAEQGVVYGDDKWPRDTRRTKFWWKKDKAQPVCAKTHNIRPGVYCANGFKANVKFDQAREYCHRAGGRVCTSDEIRMDYTSGTGCNYNWKRVWTSTPCGKNMFITAPGSHQYLGRTGGERCAKMGARVARVRCCMDDPTSMVGYPPCKSCPAGYKSKAGSHGVESCKCINVDSRTNKCIVAPKWVQKTCTKFQYAAGSVAKCNDLGGSMIDFTVKPKNGINRNVCVSNREEIRAVHFDIAKDYCASSGRRLCTANELEDNVADVSGILGRPVWTETKCSKTARVVFDARKGRSCVQEESDSRNKRAVVCCADYHTNNSAQYCATCPSNSASVQSSGKTSIYECAPKLNHFKVYPKASGAAELVFAADPTCPKDHFEDSSESSCADIGWIPRKAENEVCGSSRIGGKCSGPKRYAAAEALCASKGARLCTVAELKTDMARGSGCNLDSKKRVWTSNPCTEGHFAAGGSSLYRGKPRCNVEEQVAHVRCCADTHVRCSQCPENSKSNSGSRAITDCKCDSAGGFDGVDGGQCTRPTMSPTKKPRRRTQEPTIPSGGCPSGTTLAGSKASCEGLGFAVKSGKVNIRNAAGKKTCGTARRANGVCYGKVTFGYLTNMCNVRFMRVCTGMEIHEEIPRNLGADDACWGTEQSPKHFWSSKPCREDNVWRGGTANEESSRTVFYQAVSTPYLGSVAKPSFDTPRKFWPSNYPDTSDDQCLNGKSSNAKAYGACCADMGAEYCAPCPRNSCTDFACPVGATKRTQCICDEIDYEEYLKDGVSLNPDYQEVVNFQYSKDEFKICMPADPTDAPTRQPTTGPENHFCEANQYWNGAAGKPMMENGQGNWACNHNEWSSSHPMKGTTGWPNSLPLYKTNSGNGPTTWKVGGVPRFDQTPTNLNNKKNGGCRGFCVWEDGMTGDSTNVPSLDCKSEWTSFHGQKICSNADQGGFEYFKAEQSKGTAYLSANCAIITRAPNTRKNGGASGVQCCSKMMVWNEAKKFCAYTGGRLCTRNELENSCAERTGCDYDYSFIWSSTKCKVANGIRGTTTESTLDYSNVDGYYAMPGDQKKWNRKFPGDCIYRSDPNSQTNGHKACTQAKDWDTNGHPNYGKYQQGMMNKLDSIPTVASVGAGAKTGMGSDDDSHKDRANDWNMDAGFRYRYVDAIKDLFGWDSDDDAEESNAWPTNRPNPFRTKNKNVGSSTADDGAVCLPAGDNNDYPVFVRCCADYVTKVNRNNAAWPKQMYCLDCPSGLQNAAANGKDFYTCQPPFQL